MMKKTYSIAIVTSKFNYELTKKLYDGAVSTLKSHSVKYFSYFVPGAVEIPLTAKWIFETKPKLDAVIALGLVIRGETTHYDTVVNAFETGLMQVQLEYKKPIIFGVLTTENKEQAYARIGGAKGHRGIDAAKTAVDMCTLKEEL